MNISKNDTPSSSQYTYNSKNIFKSYSSSLRYLYINIYIVYILFNKVFNRKITSYKKKYNFYKVKSRKKKKSHHFDYKTTQLLKIT